MKTEERTQQEIIAEAYSDEARSTWKAPVQIARGGRMYIPWDIHLQAYEAYCKKWSHQVALIDLKGRGCRGGFGTEELDDFVPGWRDRVEAFGRMQAQIKALTEANNKMQTKLTDRAYMINALVQMLGPQALNVWNRWRGDGVTRVHHDWMPDAIAMTGEERAAVILQTMNAPSILINNIDKDDNAIPHHQV